jgi:hypothetical protein
MYVRMLLTGVGAGVGAIVGAWPHIYTDQCQLKHPIHACCVCACLHTSADVQTQMVTTAVATAACSRAWIKPVCNLAAHTSIAAHHA